MLDIRICNDPTAFYGESLRIRIAKDPKYYLVHSIHPQSTSHIVYDIIKKIVENKDLKDVVLNLRHVNRDVRILCEYIIDNGYEDMIIEYI